jgi:hypothetical protein
MNIVEFGGISYLPEIKALITFAPSREILTEPDSTITVGRYTVVPWGSDNNLPAEIMEKIGKSEVVSANLEFNILTGYGQGIKPMMRTETGFTECTDQRVLDFFENNDISGYFLEQLTDLKTFYNVFPEIILSNDLTQIVSLRSKEATFSRWGKMDERTGAINRHFYSAKWANAVTEKDVIITDVLDRFNPVADLEQRVKNRNFREPRFIIPVNFPTAGRTYYQFPYWWSIFNSGWYDFSVMVPEVKKALLKNRFGVKYIIYLSPKYFKSIFRDEGIDPTDVEATKARIAQEHQNFSDFLTSSENAGKGIIALKDYLQSANGVTEEKYIEIQPINLIDGASDLIPDSEEASNIISYVMGVHPSLIGATPGKNGGSLGGSDKRELFMIKQSLTKPLRDRLLRPLVAIKNFNKWPKELVFAVPDIEFTTLDKQPSGKETTYDKQ